MGMAHNFLQINCDIMKFSLNSSRIWRYHSKRRHVVECCRT